MNHTNNYSHIVISLLVTAILYTSISVITPVSAEQPQMKENIAENFAVVGGCSMFPSNNIWNTPIDDLPVHLRSDQWVDSIGRNTGFHMDFGSGNWDGGPIGI